MAIDDAKKRKTGSEIVSWLYLGIQTGALQSVAEYRSLTLRAATTEAAGNPDDIIYTNPNNPSDTLTRAQVVAEFRRAAEQHLLRAVNMPDRARFRINALRTRYEGRNGAGSATAYLTSCLALCGPVTFGELNAKITVLENEANNLHTMKRTGATLDSIAAWIEANWEDEVDESRLREPGVGYVSVWR